VGVTSVAGFQMDSLITAAAHAQPAPRSILASTPRAIAFGFSDLSLAVIPAQAGIQGRVTGFGALDSRLRGNDRGEKGSQTLPVRPCQGSGPGSRPAATSASRPT